jgi:hypothetical protein
MASDAERFKALGSAAWQAGKYDEAMQHFTSAIGASSNKEFVCEI